MTGVFNNCVRFCRLYVVFLLCFWIVACAASPDRRHPDFNHKIQPIKILCLLPADILVYEELPDGRLLYRKDWSQAVHDDLKQTIIRELTGREYLVLTYTESDSYQTAELQEILTLYRAVNKSIQLHTFGPDIFPAKKFHFNYSVGSLQALIEKKAADAYLFVRVLHRVSDNQARSYVSLGLADKAGTILWYGANGATDASGENNFKNTLVLVRHILTDFPEVRL
jgi:hypothetical protein